MLLLLRHSFRSSGTRYVPYTPLLLSIPLLLGCLNLTQMPTGLSYAGPLRPADEVHFYGDLTYVNDDGHRQTEQHIFDEVFRMIGAAEHFLLLDMFLYNDFQGAIPETTRALSSELTQRLVAKKTERPGMPVIVITDPVNNVYGGLRSRQLDALRDAGVEVVVTNLDRLPDSNPCYSLFWRILAKPFGNSPGGLLPNPFGEGRVSIRSWARLLNFKANHRKTLVADEAGYLSALVTSANPHDGSSAHRNTAMKFDGPAVLDLLNTEYAVISLSDPLAPPLPSLIDMVRGGGSTYEVSILTEGKIKDAVMAALTEAGPGDHVDLVMFYLSDREVIAALKDAHRRGATLRVLLDPNKDAFGWEKGGVPNRPVAHELVKRGIAVRWCATQGEQCHAKTLIVRLHTGEVRVITGSANFTRRNLNDLNLETDILLKADRDARAIVSTQSYFDRMWHNEAGRRYSAPYEDFANGSLFKRIAYRFQEATGMSSF
jgi:hypothetical protein